MEDAPAEGAGALYQKAAQLSQAGEKAAAMAALEKAAGLGHALSCYTLASYLAHGAAGKVDRVRALDLLRQGADTGDPKEAEALGLRAALFEARGIGLDAPDWTSAIRRLAGLAERQSAAALRQLGLLCLIMCDETEDRDASLYPFARRLLFAAISEKDGLALVAVLRLAVEGHPALQGEMTKAEARHLYHAVAQMRHPALPDIGDALGKGETRPFRPAAFDRIAIVQAAAAYLADLPTFARKKPDWTHEAPRIMRFDKAFSAVACDYLMALSAPQLVPSQIFDPRTGARRPDPYRSSLTASLYPFDQDLVTHALDMKLAALADVDWQQGEMLSVLRYGPGQDYKPHYDALDDDGGAGSEQIRASGQRIATVLVGLNKGYEGGETAFLNADLRLRLNPGDALLFYNTGEGEKRDPDSLHAGLPVKSGVKWLLSKWIRARHFQW